MSRAGLATFWAGLSLVLVLCWWPRPTLGLEGSGEPIQGLGSLTAAAVDSNPLGSRVPMILIHGYLADGESPWDALLDEYAQGPPAVRQRFKPYLFTYDVTALPGDFEALETIHEAALLLDQEVENLLANNNSPGREVAFVGHSLGGLVARDFMQTLHWTSGGQAIRNGAKTKILITLGTPHHGTPAADPLEGLGYFATGSTVTTELKWDNINQILLGRFPVCNRYLRDLNSYFYNPGWPLSLTNWWCEYPSGTSSTGYYDKIIAYSSRTNSASVSGLYQIGYSGLRLLGFPNNDGAVPEESALFDGWLVAKRYKATSFCDHSQLARGGCGVIHNGVSMDVLESVILDLIEISEPPVLYQVSPAVFPPLPLPQKQLLTLRGAGLDLSPVLHFSDGLSNYTAAPAAISESALMYNIAVGPDPADWSVYVSTSRGNSNSISFKVRAADSQAPGPISSVAAPAGWLRGQQPFWIDWTNPIDPAGIVTVRVRHDQPPTFPLDGLALSLAEGKPLQVTPRHEGVNTSYIWLGDASGNFDHLNAVPVSVSVDQTPPYLLITSPVDGASMTTPSVQLVGNSADNLSGVVSIAWSNNRGGAGVGGTGGQWFAGPVPLANGQNTITVLATDRAGNSTARQVTVSYQAPVGSIRVSLVPSIAAQAGARWKLVQGTEWLLSGQTVDNLPIGQHTVEFKPIDGWHTPANFALTLTAANQNIWVDAPAYLKHAISLSAYRMVFSLIGSASAAPQLLTVQNTGTGTLNWQVVTSAGWIAASPGSGSNNGTVAISLNPALLPAGNPVGWVRFEDVSGVNPAQTVDLQVVRFPIGKVDFQWTSGPTSPSPLFDFQATELSGKIHLIHGFDHRVFDPATQQWSTKAAPPVFLNDGDIAALDGKIYATYESSQRRLFIYDPAGNSWSTGAPMPSARLGATMVASAGKIYLIGGSTDADNYGLNLVEAYDPTTNQWQPRAPLSFARTRAMAVSINDKIFVAGGFDRAILAGLVEAEMYDPSTNSWTTLPSMANNRADGQAIALGERMYVLGGGFSSSCSSPLTAVYEYQPKNRRWRTLGVNLSERCFFAAATYLDKIYLFGGERGGAQPASPTTEVGTLVTLPNVAPNANDDNVQVAQASQTLLTVLDNDTDADDPSKLIIQAVTAPAHGIAEVVEGNFANYYVRYTPLPDFSGFDGFSYVINDGYGGTDQAVVNVQVQAPTADLRVTLAPATAAAQGAWRPTTAAAWISSGSIVRNLPLGTYTLEFRPVAGWETPPPRTVNLATSGELVEVTSFPYCQDLDRDGICDALDSCRGTNSTGDIDGDLYCADFDCADLDPLVFAVDRCGVCGGSGTTCLFGDGFESGDTSRWPP